MHTEGSSGLFTSTDPESRRVKPTDVKGRVQVKLVYVVLEAQYQSALTTTVKKINESNPKVRRCMARYTHGVSSFHICMDASDSCHVSVHAAGVL